MQFLTSLVNLLRKLFVPFPHLAKNLLLPLAVPITWYVFLRGLANIINGFRNISWGVRYQSLPEMFTTLINVSPEFFIISGLLTILAGILYLRAFMLLVNDRQRYQGWQTWAQAAVFLTITKLYEVIFIGRSSFWFMLTALLGWYLIFEFEQVFGRQTGSSAKPTKRIKKKTRSKR